MKNRISLTLDPQDVADLKAAQETQKRIVLKWLKGVDLTDIGPGNYKGTEGVRSGNFQSSPNVEDAT